MIQPPRYERADLDFAVLLNYKPSAQMDHQGASFAFRSSRVQQKTLLHDLRKQIQPAKPQRVCKLPINLHLVLSVE